VWIDEYEKLMFGENHSKETMVAAVEMKYNYMPELLFKYRSFSQHSLEALRDDFLYSSQPKEFNDIFEGPIEIFHQKASENIYQKTYNSIMRQYPFLHDRKVNSHRDLLESIAVIFGGTYEDVAQNCNDFPLMQEVGKYMDQHIENTICELQEDARNMYNICCFCAENDNDIMWAHYANQHTGFCIAYGIKELNNNLTHSTFPVIYSAKCHLYINDIDDINGSICMNMLTVKSPDWSYEKEWRTFFLRNPPNHKEQMPKPKAVFLGTRMVHNDELQISEICFKKGISLYKMEPSLIQHKLIAKPYNSF